MFKKIDKKDAKVGDIIEYKQNHISGYLFFKIGEITIDTVTRFWGPNKDSYTKEEAFKQPLKKGSNLRIDSPKIINIWRKVNSLKNWLNTTI